mgnify:CR=1 FL=1
MTRDGEGRPQVSQKVRVGSGGEKVPTEEINHISGEVEIDLSGARSDFDDVVALTKAIEAAVHDTINDFDEEGDSDA